MLGFLLRCRDPVRGLSPINLGDSRGTCLFVSPLRVLGRDFVVNLGGGSRPGLFFLDYLCPATILVSVDSSLTLGVLCFLWFLLVAVLLFLLTWGVWDGGPSGPTDLGMVIENEI